MHIAEILISEISWKPVNFPSFESQPFRCPRSGNLHDRSLNKRYLDNFPRFFLVFKMPCVNNKLYSDYQNRVDLGTRMT